MKTISRTLLLILSLFFSNALRAQTNYQQPAFPVGALAFGITNDPNVLAPKLAEFGLDAIYDGNVRPPQDMRSILLGLNANQTFYPSRRDEFYSILGSSDRYPFRATDVRYFLVSHEPSKSLLANDKIRNWADKDGEVVSSGEYFIAPTRYASGDMYLTGLQTSDEKLNDDRASYSNGYGGYVIDPGQTNAILDFVYRIDQAEHYNGIDPSTVIYRLECVVHHHTGGPTTLPPFDLKISDYLDYVAGVNSSWKTNEHPNILEFPKKSGKKYAVKRITIPIDGNVKTLKFNLRDFKDQNQVRTSKGIYVRGLRIRSVEGDNLFRKLRDAEFTGPGGLFPTFYNDLYGAGGSQSAWRRTPAIAMGPELTGVSYRAVAYIANLWANWTRTTKGSEKSMYTILAHPYTGSYEDYAAAFWDETGKPAPPIMAQNSINYYWGSSDVPNWEPGDPGDPQLKFPGDLIPSSIKNHRTNNVRDFRPFNLLVTGDISSQGDFGQTNFTEYLDYTARFQQKPLTEYITAAKAAYPESNPLAWSKFYGFPSTILGVHVKPAPMTEAGSQVLRTLQMTDAPNNVGLPPMVVDYKDATPEEVWFKHNASASSEIRQQTWVALMYGAKGIIFNTVGHDCSENGGFADIDFNSTLTSDFESDYSFMCAASWGKAGDEPIKPMPFYNSSKAIYYPDHYAENDDNGPGILVPIFSDVKIYADQTLTTVAIALNDPIASSQINAYIKGVQNGWVDYGTLTQTEQAKIHDYYTKTKYSGRQTGWHARMEDPDGTESLPSVWCAWDRSIEEDLNGHKGFFQSYHYPGSAHVDIKLKHTGAYLGFPDRSLGVKTAVADFAPLKTILSRLRWKNAYAVSSLKKTVAPEVRADAEDGEFINPLEIVASKKLNRDWGATPALRSLRSSTDLFDPSPSEDDPESGELEYGIGQFSDPEDPEAKFVMVVNKRTWPMIKNTDGTAVRVDNTTGTNIPLLGAIDGRRLQFKVIKDKVVPSNSTYEYYTLTNLRTNESITKKFTDNFVHEIDFEPGEGTLFRIAPAFSFEAGKSSEDGMSYNNGHRVAELSAAGSPSKIQRFMTWERQGKVQYAIVNNSGLSGEENFIDPSSMLDASTNILASPNAYNPSVTSKPAKGSNDDKDTIAVIWSKDNLGAGTRDIKLAIGTKTVNSSTGVASVSNWTTLSIATEPIPSVESEAHDRPTPVVTPLRDGFFCSWSGYDGSGSNCDPFIRTRVVSYSGAWNQSTTHSIKVNGAAEKVLFPTVASRLEFSTSYSSRMKDRIHIAWEEWTNLSPVESHIYYTWYDITYPSSGDCIKTIVTPSSSNFERVSKGHTSCEHHHPNIAVKNRYVEFTSNVDFGSPLVTWEAVTCREKDEAQVVLRSRIGPDDPHPWPPQTWGSFTGFYKKKFNKTPQPSVRAGQRGSMGADIETRAVVFHDLTTKRLIVERMPKVGGWKRYTSYEQGLHPSVTLPYHPAETQKLNTWTFRGAMQDESSLYAAKITARPDGGAKLESSSLAQTLTIYDATCNTVRMIIGGGDIGCDTCLTSEEDSLQTDPRRPIDWEVKDLGSDGFGEGEPRGGLYQAYTSGTTYPFPMTEDSIRTTNFVVKANDVLRLDRGFLIPDSASIAAQLADSTRFMRFEILLKDSATSLPIATIDSFEIRRSSDPIGPPKIVITGLPISGVTKVVCPEFAISSLRTKTKIADGIPLAGITSPKTGYITVKVTKDNLSNLELAHEQDYYDGFEDYIGETEESEASLKRTESHTRRSNQLSLLIRPNPVSSSTSISLAIPPDAPIRLDVFDVSGKVVFSLFDGYSPSSGKMELTLDADELSDGTYFVRAESGNDVVTKRLVVLKR